MIPVLIALVIVAAAVILVVNYNKIFAQTTEVTDEAEAQGLEYITKMRQSRPHRSKTGSLKKTTGKAWMNC